LWRRAGWAWWCWAAGAWAASGGERAGPPTGTWETLAWAGLVAARAAPGRQASACSRAAAERPRPPRRSLMGAVGMGSVSDYCVQHLKPPIIVIKVGRLSNTPSKVKKKKHGECCSAKHQWPPAAALAARRPLSGPRLAAAAHGRGRPLVRPAGRGTSRRATSSSRRATSSSRRATREGWKVASGEQSLATGARWSGRARGIGTVRAAQPGRAPCFRSIRSELA
jgi:hypothetical protein